MNFRWLRKHDVVEGVPGQRYANPVLVENLVLQVQADDGTWGEVPVVDDTESREAAVKSYHDKLRAMKKE